MFEEKISEAADALTRKQLGLEKEQEEKRSDLPKMFVQVSNVFQIELMEQLNKISTTMMQKYGLSSVSVETLDIIADKIKEEIEDEKIQSVSDLSQNKEILVVAEHATIIQKEKEDKIKEEDLENIPVEYLNYGEEINGTEKLSPIDKAIIDLWQLTKTKSRILEIAEGTTLENLSEKIKKINETANSEEAKKEKEEEKIKDEEILINGNAEQKELVKDKIELYALVEDRTQSTEQEQVDEKADVRIILFAFMKELGKIENNPNVKIETFEALKATIIEAFVNDPTISKENKVRMLNSSQAKEMMETLSEELGNHCREAGHPANLVDPKQFRHLARKQSGNGAYKYSINDFGLEDVRTSIIYATALLSPQDKLNIKNLLKQLKSTKEDTVYDFDILDKIKGIDKNLYYSMIRNVGHGAQKTNNPILKEKFEELVEKETQKELYDQLIDGIVRNRLRKSPEEQKASRRDVVSVLYNYMRGINFSNESLVIQKSEMVAVFRRDNALSSEEKANLIEKIEKAKDKQELSEVLVDKMGELFFQETGKRINKDSVLEKSKKPFNASDTYKMKAKAKLIFDESTYRKYEILMDGLIGKKFDDNVDYKVLSIIAEKSPEMYENIIGLMKGIYAKSKDEEHKKRIRLFLNAEDLEISEKEAKQNRMQGNIPNIINARKVLREQYGENKSTTKTSVKLFELMTKIYNPQNENEKTLEELKKEIYDYISLDMTFSEKEVPELLNLIITSSTNSDLGNALSKKILELSEARGIGNNNLRLEQIKSLAKMKNQHKNLSDNIKYDRAGAVNARTYAQMFLEPKDRDAVRLFLDSIGRSNMKEYVDFSILDKVKSVDEAFYYSMIRSVGAMARKIDDPILKNKYDELLANELMSKGYNDKDIFDKSDLKAKIIFDEDIYCRYNDFVQSIKEGNTEGVYDEGMLEYLKKNVPQIYSGLVLEIRDIAQNRNDDGLLNLLEKTEEREQTENSGNDKNRDEKSREVITAQNISIDEIVVSHSDGIDLFASKNKSAQTIEDSDDGR